MLKEKAAEIAEAIETIPGVVDVNDGLVVAGPSMRFLVAPGSGRAAGLTPRRRRHGTLQTAHARHACRPTCCKAIASWTIRVLVDAGNARPAS